MISDRPNQERKRQDSPESLAIRKGAAPNGAPASRPGAFLLHRYQRAVPGGRRSVRLGLGDSSLLSFAFVRKVANL